MNNKIYVTKPFLPPLEDYSELLAKVWTSKQLTNGGQFHKRLERKLAKYLGVKYLSLVNNGTMGLMIAQRALGFKSEIITTPYSFIATSHSIIWNGLKPVFVDTDLNFGNLDPARVHNAITYKTGGILGVHNYGVPENETKLQEIAKKNKIPLLYDAAPAFGVKKNGNSILKFGDASVLSFHGTKVFTTGEGGAIITNKKKIKTKVDFIRNFNIVNQENINGIGTNGKMNEFESALGVIQLNYIDDIIKKRKFVYDRYFKKLSLNKNLRIPTLPKNIEYNYAYFPIFFIKGKAERDKALKSLKEKNIFCRKYWSPLITDHKIYKSYKVDDYTNAKLLSNSVLCIPIYPDLNKKDIDQIISILLKN